MKKLLLYCVFSLGFLPVLAQQLQLLQERNYLPKVSGTEISASAQASNGDVLYSGITLSGTDRYDNTFLMVKPNLDTIWTRKNPQKLGHEAITLKLMNNNRYVFGGNVYSSSLYYLMSLQKINSVGALTLVKNYTSVTSLVNSILTLPKNDLLLSGGYGVGNGFTITRTDSMGNFRWSKDYTWGKFDEAPIDMKFTKSGNVIVAGITDRPVSPMHLKLMKLNLNGDSLIGKQLIVNGQTYSEGMYYNYNSITPLMDDGFLITGVVDTITSTFPNGSFRGMVVKVDSSLNVRWKYVHRTPNNDEFVFTKSRELADGSIIVLCFKKSPNVGSNSFQFFHFDSQGYLLNIYPFTSNICTKVWGITLDVLNDSTFMVGGSCGNNLPINYGHYVSKVKISGLPHVLPPIMPGTVTGLVAEQNKQELYLGQSYPNPTISKAIIPYNLPVNCSKASIIIREIATGREITNYDLKRGSNNLEVNLSALSNGLYMYSLVVDDKPIATRKLAVMR